jgi:hypothetical protein
MGWTAGLPDFWLNEKMAPVGGLVLRLRGGMDQFATERNAQKLSIGYVSGLRNQNLFCPNDFQIPRNHPN